MIVTLDYLDAKSFVLIFDDGTAKVAQQFYVSPVTDAAIKSAAQQYVSAASSTKQAIVTMRVGDVVDTTITPDPTTVETVDDLARLTFLADWRLYQRYQRAMSAGFIDVADKRIVDLFPKLKAEWIDAYLDFL